MSEEVKDQELQEIVQDTDEEEVQGTVEEVEQTSQEPIQEAQQEVKSVKGTSATDTSAADTSAKVLEREENIRALRASRKNLQLERDAYLKRLQDLEASQLAAAQLKKSNDVDFNNIDDEYDPNSKDIKLLKQQYAQMAVDNSRMKLYTQFPDFSKVVTEESISILRQRFPEIAATLDNGKDFYSTGVSTYNIIKKFDLYIDNTSVDNTVDQEHVKGKERVENNINKPRPVSSLKSESALSNVSDYSDLSDKKVRDEIIRIATERAANG